MNPVSVSRLVSGAFAAALTCAASAQDRGPPAPAPVPVAEEVAPYRPIPPGGAAYTMELPPLQADGLRTTLNSNLDDNATLWHFRSAWNVAALNCLSADQAAILQGYSAFLRKYSRSLAAANAALDQRFVRENGSRVRGIRAREAYMTQVYNYFALPPANEDFCNTALGIANDFLAAPPADARALSGPGLQRFEAVFQEFYRQYQQYQVDSAAWDQRWGALYGPSQPGYVAVYGILGPNLSATRVDLNAPADTGAIPVLTAPTEGADTPAITPILTGERG